MRTTSGFSLIELLVSTVLMGLLVTVVVAPLTTLFRNTSVSTQRLQESTQAQNVLEFVRGQWKPYPRVIDDSLAVTDPNYRADLNRDLRKVSRRRYDTNCYESSGLNTPSGTSYSITVNAVTRDGAIGAAQALSSSGCSTITLNTSIIPPPMKLITVTVTGPKNQQTILSAVVARP